MAKKNITFEIYPLKDEYDFFSKTPDGKRTIALYDMRVSTKGDTSP